MAPLLIGLQVKVFSVELSVYCGQHCVVCPYPEDTWLIHGISGLCSPGNLTLSKLSFWEPVWIQETASLGSKVRATSFILLLGVGSFVCYRLYHQLKRRLAKGSKRSSQSRVAPAKLRKLSNTHNRYLDCLLCEHNDLSSFSNSDFSDTSSNTSYGDRETTSDSPSLSDGDSDSVIMGISSSNPFEPVYFSKASGIHFRSDKQITSTPLDQLARNTERRHSHHKRHLLSNHELDSNHKENVFSGSGSFQVSGSFQEYQDLEISSQMDSVSYEEPPFSHDAASMHGNFSPGSLRERTQKTEQLISSKLEQASKPNSLLLKRDFSVDSFTYNSEQEYGGPASKRSVSRTLSIDSEVSELCIELQRDAEEAQKLGIVTVEKMEDLEDEINDIKQTVLELDADLVGLKVYKRPPANCWELTNISESEKSTNSELSHSGLVDVIHHHKNKMWCKGFFNASKPEDGENATKENNDVLLSPQWDQVCNQMLDWDVSVDNPFDLDQAGTDSGSDFGNSLETDSVDVDSVSVNGAASNSLEWDTKFVSGFGIYGDEVDADVRKHKHQSGLKVSSRKPLPHQSKSLHDDTGHRYTFKKKHRSQSIPEVLSEQIQGALRKRTPLCSLVSQMDLGLTPLSSQLASPMSEVKTDASPLQETYASLQSDITSSSAAVFKSLTSQDESGFLDAKLERTDNAIASGFGSVDREEDNYISLNRKDSNGNLPVVKNVNRDSAYCEDSDFPEVAPVENIGPEVGVVDHSQQQESQENLKRSQLIKKAYAAAQEKLGIRNIRSIRADNYGVIRAALYQLLSTGLPILQHYGGAATVYQVLSSLATDSQPWLLDWTFAHSLPYNNNTCLQGFWDCLQALENMESSLHQVTDRGQHLASILNRNPNLDVQLLEAVKLLMCLSASRLYSGQELLTSTVPVFVMLLFARDDSPSPKELVLNRLNRVGHDKRLQQVELYLLGYSLSVTLRIINFQHFGSQEFVTYYPDCNLGTWKESTLIAEDQQHFNVVTR